MTEELKDIKPLLEIPDYSYYLFVGLVSVVVVMVLLLLFFLGKRLWLNRKVNMKKVYFARLKSVDWADTKQTAYLVTYLGRVLSAELPRAKEIYGQLVRMLEPYKYKKEVPMVDDETLKQYNLLVHVIDESL